MNSRRAKQVLVAFRPGTGDETDPEVAEALELARSDSELQSWLEQQRAFHNSIRMELLSIPIPSDLKARILNQGKIVVPIWRRPEFLLAAACFAVALFVSALLMGRSSEDKTFTGFRSRMVDFAQRTYRMDIETNDPVQIRKFLNASGGPADYQLSAGLRRISHIGGAHLSWQTNPVSMVCFGLPKNKILFMFVIEQRALKHGPIPGRKPELESVGDLMTASWQQDGKVYLIAAGDTEALKKGAALE